MDGNVSRLARQDTGVMAYQKRLKKEYEELSLRAPTGIALDQETMEDNIDMLVCWLAIKLGWFSVCAVCMCVWGRGGGVVEHFLCHGDVST